MKITKIEDLGVFRRYNPEPRPEGIPGGIMFLRRESDGADWYKLVHKRRPELRKRKNVVYAVAHETDKPKRFTISAASEDSTVLVPTNAHVLMLTGVTEFKHEYGLSNLNGMTADLSRNTLTMPKAKADE